MPNITEEQANAAIRWIDELCGTVIKEQANAAIRWIDELCATKEKQAARSLGDDESGYCCLGLGCKTLAIDFSPTDHVSDKFKYAVGLLQSDGESSTAFELDSVTNKNVPSSLTYANDTLRLPFAKIGQLLKAHADKYFIDEVASIIKEHYNV